MGKKPVTKHATSGTPPAGVLPKGASWLALSRPAAHLAIALVSAAIYAPCAEKGSTFVFDDVVAIQENPDVTGPTLDLTAIFTHDFWGGDISKSSSHKSYRPLSVMYLRGVFQAYGGNLQAGAVPMRYKAGNVALNAVLCSLAYEAARALPQGEAAAFITALLYAAHPVRSEAVASIVGCADLLSACCALLALLCAARQPRPAATAAALLLLGTSLLFKETGFGAAPAVLFLAAARQPTHRSRFATLAALAVGLGAALYLRSYATGFSPLVKGFRKLDNPLPYIEGAPRRALATARVWVEYARLLLFPKDLSADYSFEAIPTPVDTPPNRVVLWLLFPLASVAAFISLTHLGGVRFNTTPFWVLLLLFGGTFMPASHVLFYPGTLVAERLMLVPSFVLTALLGPLFAKGIASPRLWLQVLSGAVLLCLVGCGSIHASNRSAEWKNLSLLFESAVRSTPGSAKAQLNIGIARFNEKRFSEAETHLREAERIYPEGCQVHYWVGRCHMEEQAWQKAIARLQKSIGCKERDHTKHALKALEAIFKEMAKAAPKDPDPHTNLANIFALQARRGDARNLYKHAIKLAKARGGHAPAAHLNFARLLQAGGELEEALQQASLAEVHAKGMEAQQAHSFAEELRAQLQRGAKRGGAGG